MSISTAIGTERKSRTVGYKIKRGYLQTAGINLPQVIAILGEANLASQGTLVTTAKEITSAAQAGALYGYGSPIHQIMRILRPVNSDGVGGIPTIVLPQISDGAATQTTIVWTITGTATANATHKLIIAGRDNLDGVPYSFNVASGDTPTVIAGKIANLINSITGVPVLVTFAAGVVTIKSKWAGVSSAALKVTINNNGTAAGVTYALTSTTAGTGVVSLTGALTQFGNNWYTSVINPYSDQLAALETFNGFPDNDNPTGRYQGNIFKPFMAFFGSTEPDYADLVTITDAAARKGQCTNVLCPAPNSDGLPWEAAANVVALFARMMQDTPELDIAGKTYSDMPIPADGDIGDMKDYNNRDLLVKKGCSTVMLVNGAYQVQDLVTTYHPDDDVPLHFDYCRNLNLDWEVRDGYGILEQQTVKDKVIIADGQATSSLNAVRPGDWKATLFEYFDTLATRALLSDPAFSKANLQVEIDPGNAGRFNTLMRYKRTATVRISSTDAVIVA